MKTVKFVKYGLRNTETKVLVTFDLESNHCSDFSCADEYSLLCYSKQYDDENVWLVDDEETAKQALFNGDVPWYNTTYNTPRHNLNPEQYEVVKVTTTVQVEAL